VILGTDLTGKFALVTGSSRNLGAVIAEQLAVAGATVALTYNESEQAARDLAARLGAATAREHPCFRGDLATVDGVRSVVEGSLSELGRIDVLVNNAGPWAGAPFLELSEGDWDAVFHANVKAAYLATQLVAPAMRASGWGRVVNISAGSRYLRNHSVYGLAKDAVVFLTEELACELGPDVTVNAIAPGQIIESAPDIEEFDPDFVPRAIAATPAGRLVTRAEVAGLVLAFCSPAFEMVTGATIPVDGGWRFHRF
jgi:NAD(P)-dependent dehydrogenase (short-subunit alcohol dehydrogenase family)